MSIYRRKFINVNGKTVRAETYTAEFQRGGKLHRKSGFLNREIAEQWVRAEQTRMQRGELGLTKPLLNAPVAKLIAEFSEHLELLGRSEKYVYNVNRRLTRLSEDAGWLILGNVTADSAHAWAKSSPRFRTKKISARTINQFLDTAAEFGKWLAKKKKIIHANPLAELDRLSADHNAFYRRSATMDEIQNLISHAPDDRRLFYTFLIYSPLRMRAVHRLEWDDVRLNIERPCVQVRAELDKSRKGQQLPLRLDVAQMLRLAKAKRKAVGDDRVFPNPPTIADLKADLQAAGVPFSDSKGNRRLDFHAFRRTLISLLKNAGVQMDVAHLALGHSDKRTTEKYYDDSLLNAPISNALESVPAINPLRIAGEK